MTTNHLPLDEWEREAKAWLDPNPAWFDLRILALITAVRGLQEQNAGNLNAIRTLNEMFQRCSTRAEAAERQRDRFAELIYRLEQGECAVDMPLATAAKIIRASTTPDAERWTKLLEALKGNTAGFPLEQTTAADPRGVILYFDTPSNADKFLEAVAALPAGQP